MEQSLVRRRNGATVSTGDVTEQPLAHGANGTIAVPRFGPRVRWSNTGQRKEGGPEGVMERLLVQILVRGCNGATGGSRVKERRVGPWV